MFYVDNGQYWKDTQSNWRMLGQIFQKEKQVETLIKQTQLEIEQVSADVERKNLDALMLMNNGSNIAMYNKGSRFSIIFDEFGFTESSSENIPPVEGAHGNLISFEYIADAKPSVVFLLDREQAIGMGEGKAKALFDNALVKSTPASKEEKIVIIDPNAWYLTGGGVTSTQRMIADVRKAL